MMIEKNKIENSFGTYNRGVPNSLPYPEIANKIDEYRKNVSQRLIPLYFEKIPKIRGEELIVSVKADGEYCAFYYDKEKSASLFCNSPTHRIFTGLPVNTDLNNIMEQHKIDSILIGGELIGCASDKKDFNARCRVYDFIRYSRNPQSQDDLDRIGFKAFDVLEVEGKNWMVKSYKERLGFLKSVFKEEGRASIVENNSVEHLNEIETYYKEKVEVQGHEGIVVRSESAGFKIKPVHTLDVAIIGVSSGREGTRLTKDQLSSSIAALRNSDGTYQILTNVGGGLSDKQRTEMLKIFTVVGSKGYIHPTRDGRIFKLVKPEHVAQIYYTDIITDSKGGPIMQNVVQYDDKEETWEFVRAEPFVALISPRFVESNPIRSDKTPSKIEDIRVAQVTELIEIPQFGTVESAEMEPSELLARYVFEKGEDMVRKFVLWKTNKEQTGHYPKYAIYHLDYSEGRKDPLSRKVAVTYDDAQAWELFDALVQEEMTGKGGGLKRGWSEFKKYDTRN